MAAHTCKYLEQAFCEANFNSDKIADESLYLQAFANEAYRVIEAVKQNQRDYAHMQSVLVRDNSSYPYVVLLLLLRAGMTEAF